MLPPPGTISRKHQLSSLPEPAPKRKTLAERGEETVNGRPAAPPSARPLNGVVKAHALAGPPRNTSFSSSVSSRSNSTAHSRTTSANSFSASVGSGIRPPSAQALSRPQTALSNGRVSRPIPRPATSFGNRDGKAAQEPSKRRKPQSLVSLSLHETRQREPFTENILPKPRHRSTSGLGVARRDSSLTTALSSLKLDSPKAHGNVANPRPTSPSKLPLPTTPKVVASGCIPFPSFPPLFPSLTPRPLTPVKTSLSPPLPISPLTHKKSPTKFRSFLTRDSNTLAAWDPAERMTEFESMYKDVCVKFNATASEAENLRDNMSVYKTSGKLA